MNKLKDRLGMQLCGRIFNIYVDLEFHPQPDKAISSTYIKNATSDRCEENIFKLYHK